MVAGRVAGGGDAAPVTFALGPGGTIQYACRNMTMQAFAGGLRSMMGAQLGPNEVIDDTGLKGKYNFDIQWSLGNFPCRTPTRGDRISVSEAIEKQLGLKLEERQVPTPVLIVDSVNQQPSPQSAGYLRPVAHDTAAH